MRSRRFPALRRERYRTLCHRWMPRLGDDDFNVRLSRSIKRVNSAQQNRDGTLTYRDSIREAALLWHNTLPVFRLMKCSPVQAGQMFPSYSFSEISGSSSNWCWTLRLVAGHLKMKWAIGQDMTALRTRS